MVEASAAAKIILLGEHAVVYGQPAIAVPVSDLRTTATVQPNDPPGQGLRICSENARATLTLESTPDDPLVVTAKLVLEALDASPPDVTIALFSDIPMSSGLGSGAAVSTAVAQALGAALNSSLDNTQLSAIVYEVEKIHHGTPSGIDNTVVVFEQPVYFLRGQPVERLTIGKPMSFLIASTGLPASTRMAVKAVRALYDASPDTTRPVIEAIGDIVREARQAIEQGHMPRLGELMARNHTYLQALTVSCPKLDELVGAAMNAGALGAKLSGGGRGGNMIALVTPDTSHLVERALRQAGAASIFATIVQ